MEIKNYNENDQVISQGEDGGELFIVGSGKLVCTKRFNGSDEETFLLDYSKGDVFGELALMYNAPRAANIKAKENSVLYSLDRDTFNAIVKRNAILNREKYNDFLNKVEILTTLNSYEKDKIADCLLQEKYIQGSVIINEGEEGKRFYFIMEGKAQAVKQSAENT